MEIVSLVNYREHFDIIAEIVYIASQSAKKTRIMYQANLSYSVLQRCLSEVLAASLVSFDSHSQSYVSTPKGLEFLSAYKEYSRTRQHVERRLGEVAEKRKVLEQLCCASQTHL